jgi:hypothetical protein
MKPVSSPAMIVALTVKPFEPASVMIRTLSLFSSAMSFAIGVICDRDQLWAEAAQREAGNASIRLDPKLWRSAEEEQEQRLTRDPWYDALQSALSEMKGKITSISLWEILDVRGGQRTQEQSKRLSDAMRHLGWRRANKARTIKVEGRDVMGFVCGEQPWRLISAERDKYGELLVHYDDVMR